MRTLNVCLVLAGVICCSLAAFPAETNGLVGKLGECESKAQADIDCLSDVKDGLERASAYIQKIRDLKQNIERARASISTFKNVIRVVKYAPPLRIPAEALKRTLELGVEAGLSRGFNAVKRIDSKLFPLKRRIDSGVRAADKAISNLETVQSVCSVGNTAVSTARDCITALPDSTLKTTLEGALEATSGAIVPTVTQGLTALGNIGSACDVAKAFTDVAASWPNVDGISSRLSNMNNKLKPIVDILKKVDSALKKKFCIRLIKKRCFSVQKILDGISKVFKPLTKLADKAINAVLKRIPPFNLPGLPNFTPLIDFNLNVNVPDLNFDLDVTELQQLDFDCGLEINNVCEAGSIDEIVSSANQCLQQ